MIRKLNTIVMVFLSVPWYYNFAQAPVSLAGNSEDRPPECCLVSGRHLRSIEVCNQSQRHATACTD